jgi:hypothetical protein
MLDTEMLAKQTARYADEIQIFPSFEYRLNASVKR